MEVEQRDGSCAGTMFRESIDARTPVEILSAIHDLIQDQEEFSGDQPVQVDARESTRLQQSIIRPGDALAVGILTRTEFKFAVCT